MKGGIAIDPDRIGATRDAVVARLCAERDREGPWTGELSESALATATATFALTLAARGGAEAPGDAERVRNGLEWLAATQNEDGGWGDTPESPSNVSTTTLAWVALGAEPELGAIFRATGLRAREWLKRDVGALTPASFARRIASVYDDDRTFAVPILACCALGGAFEDSRKAWSAVPALPFEGAVLPQRLFRLAGIPVVSYALPALIAFGQLVHEHAPTRNPLLRGLRGLARGPTLRRLERIQPSNGGWLEAIPLTSFVAASLLGCGRAEHPVTRRALGFVRRSVRPGGAWPIDTNLTTWLTSLSIDALAAGGRLEELLRADDRAAIEAWLLAQQHIDRHPYTGAAPGGWGWTDLPGGVPDADDTAGALIALRHLGTRALHRIELGLRWLVGLQNKDGGIPTFCRGFGRLPFDRSAPDLTAHALRAFDAWGKAVSPDLARSLERASRRARAYLLNAQASDGSWTPLWFGNQAAPDCENPLFGTARVLRASTVSRDPDWKRAVERGARWILYTQSLEGGWGGAEGIDPSIEETALALDALTTCVEVLGPNADYTAAIAHGAAWLAQETGHGRRARASPVGLYFARLWYSERLYPWIFAAAALQRAQPHCQAEWTRI